MNIKKIIQFGGLVLGLVVLTWWYTNRKAPRPKQQASEKILNLVSNASIQELDPIRVRDHYAAKQVALVYEGLLEYHYLKSPLTLVPSLAQAMPTVSDDQRIYTFTIRKGVLFQDDPCFKEGKGRELIAEDFVYSFKRLADPKSQSLNFWVIDNKLEGLNEWREKNEQAIATDYTAEIAGVRALDRYTLQFTLKHPYPQFLYTLALYSCCVVPHEAVTYYGADFNSHPVGTGPYKIENFNPQDMKVVCCKNPTFRDKYFPSEAAQPYAAMLTYAGRKLPFVDKIVTHVLTEEYPRWLKFNKGDVDIINISRDQAAATALVDNQLVPELQRKGIQFLEIQELATHYIAFNNSHPLFKDNPKLRQAMALAFDAATYNKLFYKGTAVLAQSFVPPGLAGYQADYTNPYSYDVEKAKQYLAEAGYPGGKNLPEIVLDVPATTDLRQKGEFFSQCMAKIGIHVKVVPALFAELVKKTKNGTSMMHVISWVAGYPDAVNFFEPLYSKNQQVSALWYHHPAFDALYEQAAMMPDSPERTKIYEKLNQMIAEEVPMICVFHLTLKILHHGWIKNYTLPNCMFGTEQYVDIDLAQQEKLKPKL